MENEVKAETRQEMERRDNNLKEYGDAPVRNEMMIKREKEYVLK
jgi:hypothetical protein